MKRLVIMASIAALLAAAWPSHAQPPGGQQGRRGMERPARPGPQQPPPGRDMRGDPRDRDAHDQRRAQMTPEERQQLRRDIGDHGRDVYRDRQPPR